MSSGRTDSGGADRAREALLHLVMSVGEGNGDRLPPERRIAQQLGISRGLVRRLLQELARQGLVVAKPQSAWRASGQTISEPSQTLVGFTEMATMFGYRPRGEVLSATTRLATEDEAHQLQRQALDPVHELKRRRLLDARPVSIETVVLPLSLAGTIPQTDMTDRSMFADLADSGVEIRRTDAVVEAAVAPTHIAQGLGLSDGEPVLLQRELSFDRFGRPVFVAEAYYRADSYRFRSTLWRKLPSPNSR